MKVGFEESIYELIIRASCDLPSDVESAIKGQMKNAHLLCCPQSRNPHVATQYAPVARLRAPCNWTFLICPQKTLSSPNFLLPSSTTSSKNLFTAKILDEIVQNIKIARKMRLPICQDTGVLNFYVSAPLGLKHKIEIAIKKAVRKASRAGFLRPNSIDPLFEKPSGSDCTNISFEEAKAIRIYLMLKGGGSENVSAQYALPDKELGAQRNLEGVKRCALDAAFKAQGYGCAPGILGICVGGDRALGYEHSKKQLLRSLGDSHANKKISGLERAILKDANSLGIGPMGLGGAPTLIGCKVDFIPHHAASFFVSISYACWAHRRRGVELNSRGQIKRWII